MCGTTPTPWRAVPEEHGVRIVGGPHNVQIAWLTTAWWSGPSGSYKITKAEARANAELIVRLVNGAGEQESEG